jgi:sugar transferase (PEP-CTERM/EpsH1 system associated)
VKVVFLSQRVPYPPDRGDRITTWHFLKHLLDRGAQVRVGCLADEPRDLDGAGELATKSGVIEVCAPRIHRMLRKLASVAPLLTGRPLTLPFFHSRHLAARIATWLEKDPPDLVYVYSSSMAQYVLVPNTGRRIMQFAELDSDKWRQYAAHSPWPLSWVYRREARKLLDFERHVARAFDVSLVCSDIEKSLFMRHIPDVEPTVLPNGVDTDHFQTKGNDRREPHTLIFTGVMDYEPNVHGVSWFVDQCWPKLRATFPDARLLIVGSRPVSSILALSGRDGIEVTGRVAETPPWFDRSAVAIAPLHMARGVQNKVLEAMSMALPVVTTSNAAQGLGTGAKAILIVADTAADTVTAIQRLLQDPGEARQLGQQGATFVRSHYTWERMYSILDSILDG